MDNLLHKSQYFQIQHEAENKLFYYYSSDKTETMTSQEYIDELELYISLIKEHKPKRLLANMIDFRFAITPDIQAWINENLFRLYREIGFEKIAIILSEDLFSEVSIKQTMEEDIIQSFQTAYFERKGDAYQWLLN